MKPIKVLVADDHPVFLEGFCALVKLEYPDVDIVAAVTNGNETITKYQELRPDLVLMDIRMPGMDGVEAARRIREFDPNATIMILTTFNDTDLIKDALDVGVKGYMLKETPVPVVIENIKSVFHGNMLLPGDLSGKITVGDLFPRQGKATDSGKNLPYQPRDTSFSKPRNQVNNGNTHLPGITESLTTREKEILILMLDNLSNNMIAEELHISEHTVRNYVSRIYDIVGVNNRAGLMLWALDNKLK